ncbi:MAG: hypothetical protein FWD69_02950 [Polyangiaceae bacterium]|nr:hypothetical protein [Polyangiaceae bacterium]
MRTIGTFALFALLAAGCSLSTAVGPDGGADAADASDDVNQPKQLVGYEVSTLAGTGECGDDDDLGSRATFCNPTAVAVGPDDFVYVIDGDPYNNIRKIDPVQNTVTTLAGAWAVAAQDGPCASAHFYGPSGVAVDKSGNVYVADGMNGLRQITVTATDCQVTSPLSSSSAVPISYRALNGLTVNASGDLYIADGGHSVVLRMDPDGNIAVIAGQIVVGGKPNDGHVDGPTLSAEFNGLWGIAVDAEGTVYVSESGNNDIRKMTPDGQVTTLAGAGTGGTLNDGVGTSATFSNPTGLAIGADGYLYVADTGNNAIRRVSPTGEVTTIAGQRAPHTNEGIAGADDGPSDKASFNMPVGVAVNSHGVIYVADSGNKKIRQITPIYQ